MKILIVLTIMAILIFLVACPSTPVITSYKLSITMNGSGTVTKSPDKENYSSGAAVVLTAFPLEDWEFTNWSGGLTGSSNPATVTMNSNKNITANFEEIIGYTLTLGVTGQGTIAAVPEKEKYLEYEDVELTAIPEPGWQFSHWLGDVENQLNPTIIFMDEDQVATAVFIDQFTLTLGVTGQGTVTADAEKAHYNYNEDVELTAIPEQGWQFSHWLGDVENQLNPTIIFMDENEVATAVFIEDLQATYTLNLTKEGNGSVYKNPDKGEYEKGEEVTITAVASPGWEFLSWELDYQGQENPATVTMNSDKNIHAVFKLKSYELTLNINGKGIINKDPDKAEYTHGEEVVITAVASPGWEFLQWGLDYQGQENPATVTMNSNKNIDAFFQLKTYSLVVNVNGNGIVVLDPDKAEYTHGEEVELTAIPDVEWDFDYWEGDLTGSINPEYITMNSNKEVTAEFFVIPNASPTIEKVSGPEGSVYDNNQTFEWLGSDADGTVVGYEYRKNGGPWIATINTQYTWNSITAGFHKFEARAKDNEGAYSNIAEWNFVYREVAIDWQKCLGGTYEDVSYSIEQTTDGGYIVTGYTSSNDGDVSGNHGIDDFYIGDYWVVKLDREGAIIWQKCLGGKDFDSATSIQQTSDEGFIVIGYSNSNDGDVSGNHGDYDIWIVKLNREGIIDWQKCLGGSYGESALLVKQIEDEGYIVVGSTSSNDGDVSGNHGGNDYWILKLDNAGNIIWQKCYGGSFEDTAISIAEAEDGGYIVAGSSFSNDGDVTGNHGGYDYWIIKINSEGTKIWQKCFGGSGWDFLNEIKKTNDNGYILAGRTNSDDGDVSGNHGSNDYWIVKLDNAGNIIWQKCLGGSNEDELHSIDQTYDGGYIVAGRTNSNDGDVSGNNGEYDYWVVKLDNIGNIIWQKCLGGSDWETALKILQVSDSDYIVTGHTYSNDGDVSENHGDVDFWVVKISENP